MTIDKGDEVFASKSEQKRITYQRTGRLDRVADYAKTKTERLHIQEVGDIVEVLARARMHLSKGRIAVGAELISQAENMLKAHKPKKQE